MMALTKATVVQYQLKMLTVLYNFFVAISGVL